MDYIVVALAAAVIAFVGGTLFGKHVVSEAQALKDHVTEAVSSTEGRLRAEIADLRGKIASKP